MGLEIGFNLYKKEELTGSGKLEGVDLLENAFNYVCGRCDSTNAWGNLFKFNYSSDSSEKDIVPVFQKELDGYETEYAKYKLVSLDDFENEVNRVCSKDVEDAINERSLLCSYIFKNSKRVKELRDLQKECTEDNAYAFERWGEEIQELQDKNDELQDQYNNYLEESYSYCKANEVQELMSQLRKAVEENKYLVVPFFSF